MNCAECGKELKPYCDTKKEDGKPYCIDCHWQLFGRERILKILDKAHDEITEELKRQPPNPECLKMGGFK